MKKLIPALILIVIVFSCNKTDHETKDHNLSAVDEYISNIMTTHQIPGLALAVVKDGEILIEEYYGYAFLQAKQPTNKNHKFRVYSTTKLLISTAIFQLIQNESLKLSDPISIYIDVPEKWQKVKLENLLSHSSGIPNFIRFDSQLSNDAIFKKLGTLDMDFVSGDRYSYNQTNYWLLAQIIERVSGKSLERYIIDSQFSGGKDGVLFSSNSLEAIENRVSKYNYDFELNNYVLSTDKEMSRGLAGNGLNITLEKFIKWNANLDKGNYLKKEIQALMWEPYNFKSDDKFLHGWADFSKNNIVSYGFSGGGVSAFRKFPEKGLTIIVLSNGYKYFPVCNTIVDRIAGMIDSSLENEDVIIEEDIISVFLNNEIDEAIGSIKYKYSNEINIEPILNRLGYLMLRIERPKDALKIFQLNTERYPNSYNAYDSLGEAYFVIGDKEQAIFNYKQVLKFNPENLNALNMIKLINDSKIE